jgi:hypothetical protein
MQGVAQASVWEIVTRLRQVKCEEPCAEIPPAVASDLTLLKHTVRDLISDTASTGLRASPAEIRSRVVAKLEREDIPVGDEGGFGVISEIEVARPAEYPAWLVATVSLVIPYGNDTSVYVYDIRDGAWHLGLSIESNGYNSISDAQGWLRYRVGLTSDDQSPFLVAADVSPAHASMWQALRLSVLEVGETPDHPRVLVKRTFSYNIGEPYQTAIRDGGFSLVYLGPGVNFPWHGIYYVAYSLTDGAATIARETAIDPIDFVQQWARSDRPGAETSRAAETRDWRDRLRQREWGCGLGGVQVSAQVDGGHERLLAAAPCETGGSNTPAGFAVLSADTSGFRVLSVSSTPPAWYREYGRPVCTSPPPRPVPEVRDRPELPTGFKSGAVRLHVIIGIDGSVSGVDVVNWPDRPGLVVPAIRAVRQWKFKPGTRDGCLVPDEQTVDVVFQK